MARTAVIALGGNALLKPGQKGDAGEQLTNVVHAMRHVARMVRDGWTVVLTHGNGPQVGNILLQQELARRKVPPMPLSICVAESQGQIGAMMQEALHNELGRLGIRKPVVAVVTQTLVRETDPAFRQPAKPIGPFYRQRTGLPKQWKLVKTPDGYRRIVPSPDPLKIIEAGAIKKIMKTAIVIAGGGGGVPVIEKAGLRQVDAVIDKDLASERLASAIKADLFVILTEPDAVYLNFGRPNQQRIREITVNLLRQYAEQGQFPPGSMGPKVEAAARFLRRNPGGRAVITAFHLLEQAVAGSAGTTVTARRLVF